MAIKRVARGSLFPASFEKITLSNSTAQSPNSTTRASADVLHYSIETNDARMRADGTAPTLTTGVLLQKDNDYWFYGYTKTSDFKFQRSTGTCVINLAGYKYED